jgi:hypothetical protein
MGHVDSQALHNSTDMLCKMVAQLMRMLCAQWITSIRMLCRIRLTCFQLMRGYLHNCRAQFARAYLNTSDTVYSAHIQQVGSVEGVRNAIDAGTITFALVLPHDSLKFAARHERLVHMALHERAARKRKGCEK